MLQAVLKSSYLSSSKHNSRLKQIYWLLLAIALNLGSSPTVAEVLDKIVINQKDLARPIVVEGISGGQTAVREIARTENTATGYCDGFVRSQPNHALQLESFFEFLRLEVESDADTTILVKGPGGVWCNDDAGTANPIIEGQWQPGLYEVWVGSYQADVEHNYQIKITTGRGSGRLGNEERLSTSNQSQSSEPNLFLI